jgi:hypothetical protein
MSVVSDPGLSNGISSEPRKVDYKDGQARLIESLFHEIITTFESVNTLIKHEGIEYFFEHQRCFIGDFTPTYFEEMKKLELYNRIIQIDAKIILRSV